MIDRQTVANIVPLAAVLIALSEYLLDHTVPRYASPWFWLALVATVGLLILVQILRFGGTRKTRTANPDYSASAVIRRRTDSED
jgi:hypothetical protein